MSAPEKFLVRQSIGGFCCSNWQKDVSLLLELAKRRLVCAMTTPGIELGAMHKKAKKDHPGEGIR
jgi:hypothetical protein